MPEAATKRATDEDLYSIPDNMVGEINGGELVATPRPSPRLPSQHLCWEAG